MAISSYNTDPDLNTDINGVDISEGCNPAGMNNMGRQIMADLAEFNGSDFSRALTVPPGEAGSSYPALAIRANKVALFQSDGTAGAASFATIYGGTQAVLADNRVILAAMTGLSDGQTAMLTEARREGLFTWRATNLSAAVTSDPRQGVYIAPASDTTGASGAWVRQFDGMIELAWFGTVADWNGTTGTDNAPMFEAAQTLLRARSVSIPGEGGAWFVSEGLRVGLGSFYLSRPWSIITGVKCVIDFTGSDLHFPADEYGLIINSDTTDGEDARASDIFAQDLVLLRPRIQGAGGTDLSKHGIWMRIRCTIYDAFVRHFSGDGIRIGYNGAFITGNQNSWLLVNAFIQFCGGNGIKAIGGDANAGHSINHIITLCGRFGVVDASGIGNKWQGLVDSCGVVQAGVNTIPAFVFHAGHNWAIRVGQEANTTVEPTLANFSVWLDMGAAAGSDPAIPVWVSGIAMLAGGACCSVDCAGLPQFDHIYTESGYGPCQFNTATRVIDPFGSMVADTGCVEFVYNRQIQNFSAYRVITLPDGGTTANTTGSSYVHTGGYSIGELDAFSQWGASTAETWTWTYDGTYLKMAQGNALQPFAIKYSTGRHDSLDVETFYRVAGTQVVGPRAVRPATPTLTDIDNCLAAHGLWG